MKKYAKIIFAIFIGLLVAGMGIGYAFFNYTRTGTNNRVIAGSLYLTLNEGQDTISLSNMFPETKEEARARNDNTLTFTVKGKNTSTNKDINYEIRLNNGITDDDKDPINARDLVFDLVEIGENDEETLILDAVSYDALTDQKIWIDSVERNTTDEIERTYKLRVWVSDDVTVSDSNPNADYTPSEYANIHATVKVAVEGDLVDKVLPLEVLSATVNGSSYINNTLKNHESENSQDTFILTITSSNSNVDFNYNNQSITSFNDTFVISSGQEIDFDVFLRSINGRNDTTDLSFVVTKNNVVVQTMTKHVSVLGIDHGMPVITYAGDTTTYNGNPISPSGVTIVYEDSTTYNEPVEYKYYDSADCSGTAKSSPPSKAGEYSVLITAKNTDFGHTATECGTIVINKKSLTPSVTSCNNKVYDASTSATCTLAVTGKVGNDNVSTTGSCDTADAQAANGKSVTCSSLALTGDSKDNYILSTNSVSLASAMNITKATLRVKADDLEIGVGTTPGSNGMPDYSYTVTQDDLKGNDTESVVTGTATYTVKTASGTTQNPPFNTAGTYRILVSGLTSTNYTMSYSEGTLTVSGEALCPSTKAYSGVYDGQSHTITVGTATGGTIKYRTATSGTGSTWTTTIPTRTDAGTTTVYVMVDGEGGYDDKDCGSKTITITSKEITVTADAKSRAYGAANPSFTYTVTGALGASAATFSGSLATSATASSNVGSYDITQGTLASTNSNYKIKFVKGTLSVTYSLTATTGSCKTPTYSGSQQDIVTHGNNVTYSGNMQTNVKTDGNYTVTVTPVANYAWSDGTRTAKTLSCNIAPLACNAPTNVAVSTDGNGKVTWTASSNCSSAQHQISVSASSGFANATSGVSYRSTIVGSSGTSRTVYVKAIAPNSNYTTSSTASKAVNLYTVTLTAGNGISSVASYLVIGSTTKAETRFISGETAKITATVSSGFNWYRWTRNSGSATTPITTKDYSSTITTNWDYTANARGDPYTVHFRQGKATSSSGYDELGTQTCYYGDPCTLNAYTGTFPYSSEDSTRDNYRWAFYGWVIGGSANSSSTTRDYANSATINPSNYSSDIYLYAIGRKNYLFATGIAPTSNAASLYQYWNPCNTSYRTSITVPAPTNLTNSGSWDFIGYYAGSGTSTTVTIAKPTSGFNYNSWELTPSVTLTTAYVMRSKYQRTLTVSYNKNGGDSVPSATTKVQVYNSGYASGGVNSGEELGPNAITLPAASAASWVGHDLSKWAEGSASGTKYNPGATYTGLGATVTSTKLSVVMYAIWAGKSYTIHFEQGTATGSAAHEELGTQTCTIGSTCTLKGYSDDLGAKFPYSSEDTGGNYRWAFYGWAKGASGNNASTTRDYANKATYTPNTTTFEANVYLYAIGRKNYVFATGIAPTENFASLYQYWNPCNRTSSSYRTSITVPAPTKLTSSSNGSWDFIGYYAGTGTTTAITIAVPVDDPEDYDYKSWTLTPSVTLTTGYIMRSKYQRTLKVSYDKNGGDAAPSATTLVQRYTSGYASSGANSGAGMSSNSITLASSGATRTGYNLSAWAEGSSSGTQYDPGDSYTALGATVKSTKLEETMYAKWTAKPYDITFDYQENRAYDTDQYLNTGYKINWGRDFKIVVKFKLPTLGVRHMIVGNYQEGNARNLNIEVTAANKLRVHMGDDEESRNSGSLPANTTITATYEWDATAKKYTITATASGMDEISFNHTVSSMSGTASKTLLTNRDWTGTGIFAKSTITSLKITDTRSYNTTLSDLPTFSTSMGGAMDGWYTATSGGSKISTSTKVTANKTYYARWATFTKKTYRCSAATWNKLPAKYSSSCNAVTEGSALLYGYGYYRTCTQTTPYNCGAVGSTSSYYCAIVQEYQRTGCSTYVSDPTSTETGVSTCVESTDMYNKITCTAG